LKLNGSGVAEVRENNAYRSETGYGSGDLFRIAVVGGVVKYYKNGAVFYTSSVAPSYPLVVDASLIGLGATVTNAMIASTGSGTLAYASEIEQTALVDRTFLARSGPGTANDLTKEAGAVFEEPSRYRLASRRVRPRLT
jgi:hypothetical protein